MKKSICLAAVMAMLMLLASCKAVSDTSAEASVSAAPAAQENSVSGQSDVPEQTEDEFVTVTDDLDREVTVQKHPQRVATLIGSFADIWSLAGGADSIVATADDTWTSFDLELGEDVVNLGGVKEIRLEQLLASEPELIIASTNTSIDVELLPTFEELGYTVLYFEVDSFEEYLHMLDISDSGGRRHCPAGRQRAVCSLYPCLRLQRQGKGQRGQRAGRDACRTGLPEHCR